MRYVNVTNFPSVTGSNRLQVRGKVTTGTDSGGGNSKSVVFHAYILNDLATNYGVVPAGKKLVITDMIVRHGVSETVGVSNFLLYSKEPGEYCGPGGTSRTEWAIYVPDQVSVSTNLTTGIEIPAGRRMCASSTQSISLSADLVGYTTDL